LNRKNWRIIFKLISFFSEKLVFLSQYGADTFRKSVCVPDIKIGIVNNPMPGSLLCVGGVRFEGRPRGIQKRILCMSRLVRGKGVDKLLAAMPLLPEYELTIAGAGPDESFLRRYSETLECSDRVTFAGWLSGEKKEALWAVHDIFCLPSRLDSFGVSFVEAMANGVPVVAVDWGPIPEVVSREWNVLTISDAPDDIAAGIREVQRFESIPGHWASRRADVEYRFSPARVGQAYVDLLRGMGFDTTRLHWKG